MRARKDFDTARENPQGLRAGFGQYLEAELRRYILRQFVVFVREACKLGHKRVWLVDRVEKQALEFLRLTAIDAPSSTGYQTGRRWINDWDGDIEPEVMRQFEQR